MAIRYLKSFFSWQHGHRHTGFCFPYIPLLSPGPVPLTFNPNSGSKGIAKGVLLIISSAPLSWNLAKGGFQGLSWLREGRDNPSLPIYPPNPRASEYLGLSGTQTCKFILPGPLWKNGIPIFCPFYNSQSNWGEVISHCDFDLHFSNDLWCWSFFHIVC